MAFPYTPWMSLARDSDSDSNDPLRPKCPASRHEAMVSTGISLYCPQPSMSVEKYSPQIFLGNITFEKPFCLNENKSVMYPILTECGRTR